MEKVEILLRAAFSVSHISANLKVKYFHIKHSFVIRNTQLWCFRVSWVSIFTNIASYMWQNHNLLISLHHIWVKWHTISAICKNFRGQCPRLHALFHVCIITKSPATTKMYWTYTVPCLMSKVPVLLYTPTTQYPPVHVMSSTHLHRWWHIWSHHWHR